MSDKKLKPVDLNTAKTSGFIVSLNDTILHKLGMRLSVNTDGTQSFLELLSTQDGSSISYDNLDKLSSEQKSAIEEFAHLLTN